MTPPADAAVPEPLADAERHRLPAGESATDLDEPQERYVHQLVAEQAARTPDAVAVAGERVRLSFAQLEDRANRLAGRLRAAGVRPETPVGMLVERGPEMVAGLLAILKAGGAYLPLDPAYPAQRLAYMLADAATPVLLAQERLLGRVPAHTARVVRIDRDDRGWSGDSAAPPGVVVAPDQLAYVMYTSGSTGRPKGVQVTHGSLASHCATMGRVYGLCDRDRVLQFASLSFDASLEQILPPLAHGSQVVLRGPAVWSPAELLDNIRQLGLTVVNLVPAYWERLVAGLRRGGVLPGSLRLLILGGDAVPSEPAAWWLRKFPGATLANCYGPTETTITATWLRATAPPTTRTLPIGRPIPNARASLLDGQLRPVAVGTAGELFLGGAGVARGYLGRPGLTAERFVPDPFAARPGARLYRTGDLARHLPDGNLEFLGRVDHQVKIRGHRIEPGEIEVALLAHPRVDEAVVVAREDTPGDRRLVAYVSSRGGDPPSGPELRGYLHGTLPAHMLPSTFVPLDALPRTPAGKLDRPALPAPGGRRPDLRRPYAAPRTPVETLVAGIWADVLCVDRVGVYDDFMDLGGDSLLAAKVDARLRARLGRGLTLAQFYQARTVAGLAALLDRQAAESLPPPLPSIEPHHGDGPAPLSFQQEQVWFLDRLHPGNLAYNTCSTVRLCGPLDLAVLEQAVTQIAGRHQILRTVFTDRDGEPVQVVCPAERVRVPLVDLSTLPTPAREARAGAVVAEQARQPFDLGRLPLVRWTVLRLGPDNHELIVVEHHLVHDGWSFALLMGELKALYAAIDEGRPPPLPPPAVQYADYARWQRRCLSSQAMQAQLAYWREQLAGAPGELPLPTDRPRPPVPSFRGATHRVELPLSLAAALRELSRREGVTLFVTMLSSFLALLHRYTGQDDLCVGSGFGNRRMQQTEDAVGMFVNPVAIRANLAANPTFRALLRQVGDLVAEAHANQEYPFQKLVQALNPRRVEGRNPLFQTLFSFNDAPLADLEFAGLRGSLLERSNGTAKFDLDVIVIPRAERQIGVDNADRDPRITMLWSYATDLFDAVTVRRMAAHLRGLLTAVAADPNRRLSEVPLLGTRERRWLVTGLNDTAAADHDPERCVHELVAEQAARTPDAVAVVSQEGALRYGELNARANRLAHWLVDAGTGPGTLVAICAERGLEMAVGLLGILKSGAAYVPLDPDYPPERLRFMLADAGSPVVLTQAGLRSRLPAGDARVVCMDADWELLEGQADTDPSPRARSGDLAYVIYTSGSTGRPRGVMVQHASVANLVAWHRRAFGLTSVDRTTLVASPGFDGAAWELWPSLVSGACLEVPHPETRLWPERLQGWLLRRQITVTFLPTPLAESLLELPWPSQALLRVMLTGGDRLRARPDAALPFQLVNNYGPTENTVVSTSGPVGSGGRSGPPPIGRPIANTQAYVLDAHLQPVPVGVTGELYVGGAGIARGYLDQPGLTAERFLPDPYIRRPGARLYRTGDQARWRRDGQLEFLGRRDHQIKIRGQRVELGEIEHALRDHPDVRDAVVVAYQDAAGDRHLAGYVTGAATSDDFSGYLRRRLPAYMVPSSVTVLDALPMTANGKVDRAALPPPGPDRPGLAGGFTPPRHETEQVVAEIWQQVLGLERVGVHDNFFDLGGHSLLAAQVTARLRRRLGVEVTLGELLRRENVAEQAEAVERLRAAGVRPAGPELVALPRTAYRVDPDPPWDPRPPAGPNEAQDAPGR